MMYGKKTTPKRGAKGVYHGAKHDGFNKKNPAFKSLISKGGYKCCGVDGKKMY